MTPWIRIRDTLINPEQVILATRRTPDENTLMLVISGVPAATRFVFAGYTVEDWEAALEQAFERVRTRLFAAVVNAPCSGEESQ